MTVKIRTGLVVPKVISLTDTDELNQEDFEAAIAELHQAGELPKTGVSFAYLKGNGEIVPLPPGEEAETIQAIDNKQLWSMPTTEHLYLLTKD